MITTSTERRRESCFVCTCSCEKNQSNWWKRRWKTKLNKNYITDNSQHDYNSGEEDGYNRNQDSYYQIELSYSESTPESREHKSHLRHADSLCALKKTLNCDYEHETKSPIRNCRFAKIQFPSFVTFTNFLVTLLLLILTLSSPSVQAFPTNDCDWSGRYVH